MALQRVSRGQRLLVGAVGVMFGLTSYCKRVLNAVGTYHGF